MIDLNDQQRAAAEHIGEETWIEAGPGTGKTRVLLARILHLLGECNAAPSGILALCFTRSAAAELQRRLDETLGETIAQGIICTTFHGWGMRCLRNAYERETDGGIHPSAVATDTEMESILDELFDGPHRRPEASKTSRSRVRHLAMLAQSEGRSSPGYRDACAKWPDAYALMYRWMERAAKFDLLLPFAILPVVHSKMLQNEDWDYPKRDFVMVDEGHDCTPLELDLGQRMARVNLTVVYDPRQAIFGWRGGVVPEVMEKVLGTKEVLPLLGTYRFGKALCDAANRIMPMCGLWTERPLSSHRKHDATALRHLPYDHFGDLVGAIEAAARDHGPGNVAVLTRTNRLAEAIARGVGASYTVLMGSPSDTYLEIVAYLIRLGIRPNDRMALDIVMNVEGWSKTHVEQVHAGASSRRTVLDSFRLLHKENRWKGAGSKPSLLLAVPPVSIQPRLTVCDVMQRVDLIIPNNVALLDRVANRRSDYPEHVHDLPCTEEGLVGLVDHLNDRGSVADVAREQGRICVGTVHSAKGREWPCVVVVHTEHWPAAGGSTEDWRTYYVAITRAQDSLITADRKEGGFDALRLG